MVGRISHFDQAKNIGFLNPLKYSSLQWDEYCKGKTYDSKGQFKGYVGGLDHAELPFHGSQRLSAASDIKMKNLVTFDCEFDKESGQYKVFNVIELAQENDTDLLQKYAKCTDAEVRIYCLYRKIQLESPDTVYETLVMHRGAVIANYRFFQKLIPPEFYFLKEAVWLRDLLPFKRRFEICFKMIEDSGDTRLFNEFAAIILSNWIVVPDTLWTPNKKLEPFLAFLRSQFTNISPYNTRKLLIKNILAQGPVCLQSYELIGGLSTIDQIELYWNNEYRHFFHWDSMSIEFKTGVIKKCIVTAQYPKDITELIDDELIKLFHTEEQLSWYWSTLSDPFVKWEIFSFETKVELIRKCLECRKFTNQVRLFLSSDIFNSLSTKDKAGFYWTSAQHLFVHWNEMSLRVKTEIIRRCLREQKFKNLLPNFISTDICAPLDDTEQLMLCSFVFPSGLMQVWHSIRDEVKLLFIYKSIFQNKLYTAIKCEDNEHPIVRYVYKIWMSHEKDKHQTFQDAHSILQEYIVKNAWNANFDTSLFGLFFPPCFLMENTNVLFCEGRIWHHDGKQEIFCPRTRTACNVSTLQNPAGSRVYPLPELPSDQWRIGELLLKRNIVPSLPGLNNPVEYAAKVSGWINRLLEIRERLRCSVCGEFMVPNMKYAKHFAAYNMTIASCSKGEGHDKNIYLNHCWACTQIIDSRENVIQVEKYFLCNQCGSGPQKSATYRQGDICPRDGHRPMKQNPNNPREFSCEQCGHSIYVPPAGYLTG